MIFFDKESKIFYLENNKVTYAFGINSLGLPEHLYYGSKISHDLYYGEYSRKGRAHLVRSIDKDGNEFNLSLMPREFNTPYAGDYNEPSLILEFPNGNRRSDFEFDSYEILDKKPALEGLPSLRDGQTLKTVYKAKDVILELYHTICDKEGAVARSMKIINASKDVVRIERAFSFSLDLPRKEWQACYVHGCNGNEQRFQRTPLDYGTFTLDSKRGVSSAVINPFMALVRPETTETSGTCYGINLIYSGSFSIKANALPSDHLRITGGINDFDFEWKLEAGESFVTPEAVIVYSSEGISGMSREFHDVYRAHLIPERFVYKPRPIVINNWEATRFLFTMDKLRSFVDRVEGTGIDTFVLDDGWFGKRDDATSGLGDWFVNEEKVEGGLKSFIDYVHSKGLKFGLWFEPEMVNRDTNLFRLHPDWAIQTPDEYALEGRNQLFLDLTREDVREYLATTINDILDKYDIDYFKWDCNRDMSEGYSLALPIDRQKETYHRQVLGLYDLFEKIVASHPDMLFEGCASGGSRFDAGILYWFPQIWTSDQTDAPARCIIQYGTSMCYPLSSQSCHITESPNRRGKHITPLDTRAAIAHLGANGYELDTTKMTDEEIAKIPSQVEEYRATEDLILKGDLYRLANPLESNFFAFEIVAKDKSKAKLTVMKYQELFNEPEIRLYPEGLDESAVYYVPELDKKMSGASWHSFGFLPEFIAGDFIACVYHFNKV